ncbi:uncharacterized protein [Onthophagus taurus]|uniref:uncharacterized protein n=1 Tax=Onthophagus taurus TaxID=166361 RepID=UPI0039BDB170
MEELKPLLAKKKLLKAQLTRFGTFLEKITTEKLNELKIRLQNIKEILHEFNKIQNAIDLLNKDDEYNDEYEIFETKYYELIAEATTFIQERDNDTVCKSAINDETTGSAGAATAYAPSDGYFHKNVKLPTLDLPKFYGDYDQWIYFHDTFKSLVDNDNYVDDINKFHYLFSCLKGEAANIIQSLEITKENYKIAWDMLRQRYENKAVIVKTHVKALFELPMVTKEAHQNLRRLIDSYNRHTRSLKALGEPVEHWSTLLTHLIFKKLDDASKMKWEEHAGQTFNNDVPNIKSMIDFLTNRCSILETIEGHNKTNKHIGQKKNERTIANLATNNKTCVFCESGDHIIYGCNKFKALTTSKRVEEVKKLRLCLNCLRSGHFSMDCKSLSTCKACKQKHNTLLHYDTQTNTHTTEKRVTTAHTMKALENTSIILATAQVHIKDATGKWCEARALLDSGSQSNFMTMKLVEKLQLHTYNLNVPVTGISQCNLNVKYGTNTKIKSIYNSYTIDLSFLVIRDITDNLPNVPINIKELEIPRHIRLADPKFHQPGEIDILIGAGLFAELLSMGQIKLGIGLPVLQKSTLGWIVSGPMSTNLRQKVRSNVCINNCEIQRALEKFWKVEECTAQMVFSAEEKYCENLYQQTTTRDNNGHFVVQLPTKDNISELGTSFETAEARFVNLERKLFKNQELWKQYSEFMSEYQELGHMTRVNRDDTYAYYLPHHAVIKDTSSTTRLRVVFDASTKTSTGISLNDTLMVGPTIQQELFSILCRFREHNYVLTGDIAKMYRQVNIIPSQRNLQRIIWRQSPEHDLEHFQLNTVTYGTASASFLAIRSLHQVGINIQNKHPNIAKVIIDDFYVDDLITGSKTLEEALKLKNDLSEILNGCGFELRKWNSNSQEILQGSDETSVDYLIGDSKDVKTLGILWCSQDDTLKYSIKPIVEYGKLTKRIILSIIAQIFDPLGIVSPSTIKAKVVLQRLWQLGITWDEAVPIELYTSFKRLYEELQYLAKLQIDRHILLTDFAMVEMHGFSDASEMAYGACIYIKTINQTKTKIRLLCAKSRVAPLRKISLPRLELNGCLLLAELVKKVLDSLNTEITKVYLWTDSTIALAWIHADPSRWQTFVANRVSQIQELTAHAQWKHVTSAENPADLISRGIETSQLIKSNLWWEGPKWLKSKTYPDIDMNFPKELPEKKKNKLTFHCTITCDIFDKYSSLNKLKRVVAYCMRFYNNLREPNENKIKAKLTALELESAFMRLLKVMQRQEFKTEIDLLMAKKNLPKSSKLLSLNPMYEDGLLRVGGRLRNSEYDYDIKHPIILAKGHPLTNLIIREEHLRNLHLGPQGLLSCIRQRFWPVGGLTVVKGVIGRCIVCFRTKPVSPSYLMGDLPRDRTSAIRPFYVVGIDFAGPFNSKDGKLRNRTIIKSYVCLFVCFATKAVHIEVVSDLSTDSFLNAFKRFVSRRGLCKRVYTDNATNFVGAKNYLNELKKVIDYNNDKLERFCLRNNIDWQFIPARSPHFGGLWESAIKSAKSHFIRIIGCNVLTFEELTTIFTQIEAILNSRPLTPLSTHPDDFLALTPGHFLIGEPLNTIPQRDVMDIPFNRLNQFNKLQQMYQHFWRRWSMEYINILQQRGRWSQAVGENVKIGQLILLKEDNTPPLKWRLGRILEVHPGSDNIVRVISVKTTSGVAKRAVKKVCVLPIDVEVPKKP